MERLPQRIEDLLLGRIMEGFLRRIEDRLLKRIMENLPQRVDELPLSKAIEGLPQEEGHAATGDEGEDLSTIYQAEDEAQRSGAVQKGRRQSVLRQHEW